MTAISSKNIFLAIAFIFCFFHGMALASAAETQSVAGLKSGTIAVMPFFTGEYSTEIEKGRPPLQFKFDQIAAEDGDRYSNGEKVLTKLMYEALQKKLAQQLIPRDVVQSDFENISMDSLSDTPLAVAVRLGKKLQADYVVVGIVWEYKARVGSKLAADNPASVSFSAFLVDVAAAKRIWREKFTKKQQSLSDNLLNATEFFKQGAKWLTAEELAKYGIKKVLVSFPLGNK